MFRRQRLEQAVRYTSAGIRPRSAYADLGATAAAEAVHASGLPAPSAAFFRTASASARGCSATSPHASRGAAWGARPSTASLLSSSGRDLYGETLQATAAMAAAPGGQLPVPLPKQTYIKVYDRMAHEASEAPGVRAAAVAAARAEKEEERRQVELAGELQALDTFEARMRSLQRSRSRAQHAQHVRGRGNVLQDYL